MLIDYHLHSNASEDAHDTMADMALACEERGFERVCFTDHCDLDHYITGKFNPGYMDFWPSSLSQYRDTPNRSKIQIALGIELSAANHYPELAKEVSSMPELDFIIGSIHNLLDTTDFYGLEYESAEQCESLLDAYMAEHLELADMDCFDVVGHIGYTARYMLNAGFTAHVTVERHGEYLRELFGRLIAKGRGIEMNVSGFRHPGIAGPIPSLDIVKLYRELGGEIITIGSDAHRTAEAGLHIDRGLELLASAGFEYVTVFNKRKPEFIRI